MKLKKCRNFTKNDYRIRLILRRAVIIEFYQKSENSANAVIYKERHGIPQEHTAAQSIKKYLLIWSFAGITLAIITAILYLKWPGFGEQGEVNFSAVSWLVFKGYPVYTGLEDAGRYSLQHGPLVYLIVGGIMKLLGPSYITAKLAGVAGLLLSILLSFVWFSKLTEKRIVLCLIGLETWILLHWHNSFYLRPDSLMLFCVSVAMYSVTTVRNRMLLVLGTAIPLGLIINLKIHGIIYFIPILAIALRRLKPGEILSLSGIALILGITPFLLPQISLSNYILWITKSVHMGIMDPSVTLKNFLPKIAFILELCIIPLGIGVICGINIRGFYSRNKILIVTTLLSLIIISVIASKPGSGTNHFMPVIPIYCYILLLFVSGEKTANIPEIIRSKRAVGVGCIVLSAVLCIITFSALNKVGGLLRPVANHDRTAIIQELALIEKLHEGKTMEIGYGNGYSEKPYNDVRDCIPLPVFHGNPLLVEGVALGDMGFVGVPIPPATIKRLEEGSIQVWLIPAGNAPFANLAFSDNFRQAFLENYSLVSRMNFFDVWVYNNARG